MRIREFGVEGYKTLSDNQKISIDDLTVLIGKNNAGKSNLVDAILEYANRIEHNASLTANKQETISTGKKADEPLKFEVKFELDEGEREKIYQHLENQGLGTGSLQEIERDNWFKYIWNELAYDENSNRTKFDFYINIPNKELLSREETERRNRKRGTVLQINNLPNVSHTNTGSGNNDVVLPPRPFEEIIKSSLDSWTDIGAFRHPQNRVNIAGGASLQPSANNLAQVLHSTLSADRDRFDRISDTYSDIMAGVEKINTPIRTGQKTTIEVSEEGFNEDFELSDISAGSKEILSLITQIYLAEDRNDVVFLEEPELHLHPGAQERIYEIIEKVVDESGTQVILSTHSEVFVNQTEVDSIVRVERDKATNLRSISEEELPDELTELGYSNSGMLQSDAVVFVEGRTERKVLPVFAEKLDFQFNNVAIVPLEGGSPGKSEKIAIKVLDSFKIPYLFLIDSHGEPKESRRGEYMDKINLDDEDAWWEVEPEDFHVWSKYGIESYLVDSPEAIAKNLGEDDHVERLQEMIDEESGDMTPAIEKIYGEFGLEYDKVNDGRQIARHMTEDDLDDEVERVIRKVENLI